ncbi:TAD2-tRNA-specific adenosine deaminase 2 [Fusarium tjaetaba]|uniref:TAD2-tRNA-specific adenosine deaminase 2 n=1 Tax=Fusarium tjaetaba TaxID=1567544 RepID=A0A8H5RGA5_9HYPO|nr:TAD2-tRNA-specific adenosine deaminase 2 [Fusarium tjaetaba]KAF5631371.1 TAD2-tRNA-specific adenosine deaminase 2 [Fusarium tjaetaba]
MGVFKSLGLSPAKAAGAKAFRRLFGRVLPGETDSASASDTDQTGRGNSSNDSNIQREKSNKTNPDSSSTKHHNRHQQDALTDTETSATASDMASPQKHVPQGIVDKENQPPSTAQLSDSLSRLKIGEKKAVATSPKPLVSTAPAVAADDAAPAVETVPGVPIYTDPAVIAERAIHMKFTEEALDMARLALRTNETPVGCVLVHDGKVIARGMNATNVTRNGTRHAEFMALGALLSYPPKNGPRTTYLKPKPENQSPEASDASSVESSPADEGNEDGSKGHLYPYGQKCHPDARVDRSIIRESTLYVTVEPCVMCASLLRQLGIKKVYFGAVNDKFGGTGGVFSIHANSLPVSADGQTASAHPTPKPAQLPDGSGTLGVSYPPGGGDGGNLESGYEIEGGWGRDEAVALLRRFYVQENGRAPVPRKKEGRAARLAAMMGGEGAGEGTGESNGESNGEDNDEGNDDENGEEPATPDLAATEAESQVLDLPTSTQTLKETPAPLGDRTNV